MSTQDQERVLSLITSTNKPYSLQQLQDFLAVHGLKKAAITKAVDALIEAGKVRAKDFGKTKIFIPDQSRLPILSKEELDAKATSNNALKQRLAQAREQAKVAEAEREALRQCLTLEQIQEQISHLQAQSQDLEEEVARLKGMQGTENPADREKISKEFVSKMEVWRKHRGIFRSIWSTMYESMEGKESDLFEEIGVDTDESVGADAKKLDNLFSTVRVSLNKEAKKRRL
uniref:Homologous-pairing protein 2 homolog n=1 Tax=Dunaliella tertiolecta TaxID=3047 RepID=A0A7S3QN42_DUNTE|mmetsp:Transcript_24570/g.67003  ORF Transcript_24570/g.67003 Transcript_24570/m.67003 type:complete len:230 (+) Transcript_24570:207-896(+)|eukprot:CAMPEP_0202364524 /NCGR_PEP_ID=MMETSP1126-20121109/15901_1 /ASSEMBLY_ACC=CAM_ASM_000457 /TAXON_ID=3047 /ORGANISM="Dunaliella tertiolecta, Strain CCMP1320" /LENGTH=229 /DNA_ID=CAMNT_0048959191 /DNA_START=203 /DNA_END=892 /DNA_ORIENTATION=-